MEPVASRRIALERIAMNSVELSIPFAVLFLVTAPLIAFFTFRRGKRRAERLLLDGFGKIPSGDEPLPPSVAAYHNYLSKSMGSTVTLDSITWNDLNMDDVFHRINTCSSTIGEEYLFHALHELERGDMVLKKREQMIQWAMDHPKERLTLQWILRGLGKRSNNGLSYCLFHADQSRIKHAFLFVLLAVLPMVGLLILPFSWDLGIVATFFVCCVNCAVYYVFRLKMDDEMESLRYFSAMLYAAKKIDGKLRDEIEPFDLPLRISLKPFKTMGGIVSGRTKTGLAELEALVLLFKAVFLVDILSFNKTIGKLRKYQPECRALFSIIGELDMAVAAASFRKSLVHWCAPAFHEERRLDFMGIHHPLIMTPVVNDGCIANDSLITGSNASGKSTFIKALAVNGILAQTIHTCCAHRFGLRRGYVATSMALRDDIIAGESYFIAEIKSIKRILQYCDNQYCMCFIDEILRGTNAVERIAASIAVLKHLHGSGSLCVVATHDIELTRILGKVYTNYHFGEEIIGEEIFFDYLMKDGPSTSTNAIKLLEIIGLDKRIIDEANQWVPMPMKVPRDFPIGLVAPPSLKRHPERRENPEDAGENP